MTYNQIFRKKVGSYLMSLRLDRGMTRVDAAKASGISRQHILTIENGAANYSIDVLTDYLRILKVHIEFSELNEKNNNFTMMGEPPPSDN